MRILILTLAVLFASSFALAQETEQKKVDHIDDLTAYQPVPAALDRNVDDETSLKKLVKFRNPDWTPIPKQEFPQSQKPDWKPVQEQKFPQAQEDNKFHLRSALWQSGLFLAAQHIFRFTEQKTRSGLNGPFFRDWKESVKNLRGWDDGGKTFTNYVAHPWQGAVTARIFINNSGRAKRQEFGRSGEYWKSRLKAMAWTAVVSAQFEIGPISEASLGNVGQTLHANGRSKLTYADFVLTPVLGTGVVVVEDIIDKYVLKNWLEKKGTHRFIVRLLRSVITPLTAFANPFRFKTPWTRDFRRY